jgi:hypothetical protein
MVEGPHMRTPEQGDSRLNPEGSSRLSILDSPWLHKDVQGSDGAVLVGEDEGRYREVRRSM